MVANKKQVANYCFYTHTHTFCEYQTLPWSRSSQWSMWAVMWDTSELHWQEASYNAQDVWYKVQQQAVHMYGSIHICTSYNNLRHCWDQCKALFAIWQWRCEHHECREYRRKNFHVPGQNAINIQNWQPDWLECWMLRMWYWNRNRFYSNVTLTTLVTQHWHQHHSELGSALGNVICISYAA